jgi:adenylyl-sulfate kinase
MDPDVGAHKHLHEHAFRVGTQNRSKLLNQTPAILWFTGLSGAGKSTVANAVETRLHETNRLTFLLDGDSVRRGLCKDLSFGEDDRHENVRRIAEVARLMADAGLIVLVCCIAPFDRDRAMARELAGPHRFAEIHVHAPLNVVEARDPKGLYRLARSGAISNFTGIDSPYEIPAQPEVRIETDKCDVASAADLVLHWVETECMVCG